MQRIVSKFIDQVLDGLVPFNELEPKPHTRYVEGTLRFDFVAQKVYFGTKNFDILEWDITMDASRGDSVTFEGIKVVFPIEINSA